MEIRKVSFSTLLSENLEKICQWHIFLLTFYLFYFYQILPYAGSIYIFGILKVFSFSVENFSLCFSFKNNVLKRLLLCQPPHLFYLIFFYWIGFWQPLHWSGVIQSSFLHGPPWARKWGRSSRGWISRLQLSFTLHHNL